MSSEVFQSSWGQRSQHLIVSLGHGFFRPDYFSDVFACPPADDECFNVWDVIEHPLTSSFVIFSSLTLSDLRPRILF